MKTKLFIAFTFAFVGLRNFTNAQLSQIVFTSDSVGTANFWSVIATQGALPLELTPFINAHAVLPGNNQGPINVSHNGQWYAFLSERFDNACVGWSCLTVADSNFANITSIHDGNGNVIHNEGVASVSDNGRTIIYSSDQGTHSRDMFIIHKIGSNWTVPLQLSTNSTYAYNINGRFSFDETKIIFQGQSTSFPGESIMIVDSNGTNLTEKINRNATVNGYNGCSELHMPSFTPDLSIFFEGHWGGERVWYYPALATLPVMPDSTDGDDNSPISLPDGRFASLQMPNSTHDLKVENTNGTGKFFLTGSSTFFQYDISDVGLGAGLANSFLSGIVSPEYVLNKINIYPNPFSYAATLQADKLLKDATLTVYNLFGQIVKQIKNISGQSVTLFRDNLPSGLYFFRITQNSKTFSADKFVITD